MILSDKSMEIIKKRYLLDTEISWTDLSQRIGTIVGNEKYKELFTEMLAELLFIPGGRILRNVGRPRGSLFNCYCLPIGDSREEIGELFKNALILWGEGGGIGINFSTLRPIGATIKGVGGKSSGLVSFMRAVDGIASTIESGGQRRAASLGLCDVSHPEIEHFIDSKLKDGDISYFNISVGINEQFLESVRTDSMWDLRFNQQVWKQVNARDLWNKIISGMLNNGEPGLLNLDNLTQNNSYYFAPIRACNPCGEVALEDYGVCNLGSLVLPKFVSNGRVQWSKLEETIDLAVRFLDTCIDLNHYTLDRIKQTAQRGRRIGVGVMGYADMLFDLQLRYGGPDALDFTDKLFKRIRNYTYQASIKVACEKGAFPAFDEGFYSKAKFIKTLPMSLRRDIRTYGTRNVTCLAIAPTGTISLIPEYTSSIEPLLYKAYIRKDRVSDRIYLHKIYRQRLRDNEENYKWFVDSSDISPTEHIETQATVQRYIDGAVSKTILLPSDFKPDDFSELILESIQDLKGLTVYREGTRKNQIITPLSNEETLKYLNESSSHADIESVSCASGTCEM